MKESLQLLNMYVLEETDKLVLKITTEYFWDGMTDLYE